MMKNSKSLVIWLGIPFILGISINLMMSKFDLLNIYALMDTLGQENPSERNLENLDPSLNPPISAKCKEYFQNIFQVEDDQDPFKDISLVLHKNGETNGFSELGSKSSFYSQLLQNFAFEFNNSCPRILSKYHVESLMSQTIAQVIGSSFLKFCDAGPTKTPVLLDHQELIPVRSSGNKMSLPCRFHTREGLRIASMKELTEMTEVSPPRCQEVEDEHSNTDLICEGNDSLPSEIHLFAVPAGRVFMFAPSYVGEIFHLGHVEGADDKPIYLKVLSVEPRVFDVFNFFSREESQELVDKAITEASESHKIKRSSTGASGYNINSRRTSESGFDTHGKTATKVKKRCFSALGFDTYWESHGDGLQILRYNITTAYNSHMDWIADSAELEHDYQSAGVGGNRFATILMYMSDMRPEDGGETVFPKGWPYDVAKEDRLDHATALKSLRESERGQVLKRGSWEENLVATCRSRLSIRPHSSRAVLFYSQLPDGSIDPASLHGACPVLSGQKYAANLWVWNTPRTGYRGSPIKEKFRKDKKKATIDSEHEFKLINASFKNTGKDDGMKNAKLYYENDFWRNLGHDDPPMSVNTYEGHIWNVKVDEKIVKTWRISEKRGLHQKFTI